MPEVLRNALGFPPPLNFLSLSRRSQPEQQSEIAVMHTWILRNMLVAPIALAAASIDRRTTCGAGYTLCAPSGASSANPPTIGSSAFQSLFVDIVESSLPASKRDIIAKATDDTASLCCVSSLEGGCLLMSSLLIPFCYDKFTTNYHLSDGSYGTVVGGAYTSGTGDTANLETGDYTLANGQTGNIYSAGGAPNIATLPMPSQFSGTGTGSAIPVNSLGFGYTVTYTTTLPPTTIAATTIQPSTIPQSVETTVNVSPSTFTTTISNSAVVSTLGISNTEVTTIPATTISASTIPGSTVTQRVTVITTTQASSGAASSTSGGASASTTKKSAAPVGKGVHLLLPEVLAACLVVFLL